MAPYVYVGPGNTVKLPFGIESVAEIIDGDGRWESGLEWQPEICGPASVYRSDCFGANPNESGESLPPLEPKDFVDGVPTSYTKAFAVYSGVECSPVGNFWEIAEARGRNFLLNGRERAVESQLALGTAYAGPFLTDSTTEDVTPVAGTPVTRAEGIALLEQWIGENGAGQGVILGSRRDVLLAASDYAVVPPAVGQRTLYTMLNTPVAALSGFDFATGPNSEEAGTGEAWLFALGSQPRIWRGEIFGPPKRESLDRGYNDLFILHEQMHAFGWNCGQAAVLISAPTV